ncbi:DUF664 domain-containing protein [Streptomyces sp. SL13]|uniref:DUF664 domain-containing protein n=1 Tax=Streptantibioticus silvisoli TaxID=2705255 RepID=A0AA90H788_9ACTN|nr:DUF664 domain-containing protein [Streptantibioticus silvisoli]MDI5962631.1 DUF664 domain-containing protein [Streptantibioticus silvisoli]MDI5969262.1 DUF664 domain-containing protein [Streptantibioticus silvisoli]
MTGAELLVDTFGRVREVVREAVDGLSVDQLAARPDAEGNSVAWLVWHLTRVQDDHVGDAAGTEEVWTSQGWADRFALPLPASDTGYGHGVDDVAAVRVDAGLLLGYHDAVCERTTAYVGGLSDDDFDRVVDEGWSPPVTLGVRLVSVVGDTLQHAGQAAFTRGIVERRA